jgi:hypothetical protein
VQLPVTQQERVIPFGKYKNQPYEILLADASYALWLLSSMFAKLQEQHPSLLAFLVSRYGQPDSTPEHNRLQNRFLDTEFALRFALAVSQRIRHLGSGLATFDPAALWAYRVRDKLEREKDRAARMRLYEKGDSLGALRDDLMEQAQRLAFVSHTGHYTDGIWHNAIGVTQLQFEKAGADVSYFVECGATLVAKPCVQDEFSDFDSIGEQPINISSFGERDGFRIEVKPIVGDDYPAILRSMKAVNDTHLLVGEYCGAGATWDEVVRIFALSGICAVRREDVEQTPLPESFKTVAIQALSAEQAQDIVRAVYSELTIQTGP